ANGYSDQNKIATAYVASPGRLAVLRLFFSETDIKQFTFPKQAYSDLLRYLSLPAGGYYFRTFDAVMAHELSQLTSHLSGMAPYEAIAELLKLRDTDGAKKIRKDWQERLWAYSESCSIGRQYTQIIKDSVILGTANQVIHATPS